MQMVVQVTALSSILLRQAVVLAALSIQVLAVTLEHLKARQAARLEHQDLIQKQVEQVQVQELTAKLE
jgi:hypothetical protein